MVKKRIYSIPSHLLESPKHIFEYKMSKFMYNNIIPKQILSQIRVLKRVPWNMFIVYVSQKCNKIFAIALFVVAVVDPLKTANGNLFKFYSYLCWWKIMCSWCVFCGINIFIEIYVVHCIIASTFSLLARCFPQVTSFWCMRHAVKSEHE